MQGQAILKALWLRGVNLVSVNNVKGLKIMIDYNSLRWKHKRAHVLKRDGYMCQESKRYGKRVDADMVHHIWPVDDYPEYAWCDWNLISLANTVHNKMHDRITNKLTALGEALKKRTKVPDKK